MRRQDTEYQEEEDLIHYRQSRKEDEKDRGIEDRIRKRKRRD
jgi:hypothetical protein